MAFTQSIGSLVLGLAADSGSATSTADLNAAWVYGTSGPCWFVRFTALKSQTNANLTIYAYCTSLTGAATFKCELRSGPVSPDDPDRPHSSAAVISTSGDVSPTANRWATFSLTGVTLTEGATYFAIVYNSSADPTATYGKFQYRGAADSASGLSNIGNQAYFTVGTATTGFTADATATSAPGTAVVTYADGAPQGWPYVIADSAHAGNQNDRGNRLRFDEQVLLHGILTAFVNSGITGLEINSGAVNIKTVAVDYGAANRAGGTTFDPVTLDKDTDYDFVFTYSGNSTHGQIYTMGETSANLPADVLACRPSGNGGYVDGATPGSYTLDTSKIFSMYLLLCGPVAQTGGAGGLLTHPGMSGGMRG